MQDVPEEKKFWVVDGTTIKNLEELSQSLRAMNEETFNYHVNENKNDFYNWIKDVIQDEELAESIQNKDRITTSMIISKKRKRSKIRKCPYISPVILECHIGGEAHIGCLHPTFHENCEVKQNFEISEKARRKL